MDYQTSVINTFKDMIEFKGRASKEQFWHWIIVTMVVGVLCAVVDAVLFPQMIFADRAHFVLLDQPKFLISDAFNTIVALPTLSLTTRRLHDVGRSGHWQWLYLTIIGVFVVYYWCFRAGETAPNRYGSLPE